MLTVAALCKYILNEMFNMQRSSPSIDGQKNNSFGHMITDGHMMNRRGPSIEDQQSVWSRQHPFSAHTRQKLVTAWTWRVKNIDWMSDEGWRKTGLRSLNIYNHVTKMSYSGHVICDDTWAKLRPWKIVSLDHFMTEMPCQCKCTFGEEKKLNLSKAKIDSVKTFLIHVKPL